MKKEKNFGALMMIAGSIISLPLLADTYATYLGIVFMVIGLWSLLGLHAHDALTPNCEFSTAQEETQTTNGRPKYLLANTRYTSASSFERILPCNIDDGTTICFTVKNCGADVSQSIEMVISQYYDADKIKEIFRKEVGAEQTVSQLLLVSGGTSTCGRILFEVKCSNETDAIVNMEACVIQR